MAGWSPRVSRCRSRQLADKFSSPSSNHFTQGMVPVRTFWNGLVQASSVRAISAQNASGSSTDCRYRRW